MSPPKITTALLERVDGSGFTRAIDDIQVDGRPTGIRLVSSTSGRPDYQVTERYLVKGLERLDLKPPLPAEQTTAWILERATPASPQPEHAMSSNDETAGPEPEPLPPAPECWCDEAGGRMCNGAVAMVADIRRSNGHLSPARNLCAKHASEFDRSTHFELRNRTPIPLKEQRKPDPMRRRSAYKSPGH